MNDEKLEKYSYFQGTTAPKIGVQTYKPEPRLVDMPRFKEPLYHNYDTYDVIGLEEKPVHGPGAGYHELTKYKSVKDFIEAKRKRLKDKYKADDSYVMSDGSIKKALLDRIDLVKLAIDFQESNYPMDSSMDSQNISVYENSTGGVSGRMDMTPYDDFEGKSFDKLDFGRDYVDECKCGYLNDKGAKECVNCGVRLVPAPISLYGLPDGISPVSDLDANETKQMHNPFYGTTDSCNTVYNT